MTSDFVYEKLISSFFVNNILIPTKKERVHACTAFVETKIVKNLFVKYKDKIVKKVASLEVTFTKKWREANCESNGFKRNNEAWLQRKLEVYCIHSYILCVVSINYEA